MEAAKISLTSRFSCRRPKDYNDPASCLPDAEALFALLKNDLESSRKSRVDLLSDDSQRYVAVLWHEVRSFTSIHVLRTAMSLDDDEIDFYLDFCEKALLRPDSSSIRKTGSYLSTSRLRTTQLTSPLVIRLFLIFSNVPNQHFRTCCPRVTTAYYPSPTTSRKPTLIFPKHPPTRRIPHHIQSHRRTRDPPTNILPRIGSGV